MKVEAGQEIGKLGRTGSTIGATGYHTDITMASADSFPEGNYKLNSKVKGLWTAQKVKDYISGATPELPDSIKAAFAFGQPEAKAKKSTGNLKLTPSEQKKALAKFGRVVKSTSELSEKEVKELFGSKATGKAKATKEDL